LSTARDGFDLASATVTITPLLKGEEHVTLEFSGEVSAAGLAAHPLSAAAATR
jgi:hypothetical protein